MEVKDSETTMKSINDGILVLDDGILVLGDQTIYTKL